MTWNVNEEATVGLKRRLTELNFVRQIENDGGGSDGNWGK